MEVINIYPDTTTDDDLCVLSTVDTIWSTLLYNIKNGKNLEKWGKYAQNNPNLTKKRKK